MTIMRHSGTKPFAKLTYLIKIAITALNDITLEIPCLLPSFPHDVCPADVGFHLAPHYSKETPPSHHFLALDVVTYAMPELPVTAAAPTPTNLLPRAHQQKTINKLTADFLAHLNSQGIFLLPFMIDHLGSLGADACSFLFSSLDSPIPSVSSPLSQKQISKLDVNSQQLAAFTSMSPSSFLPWADHAWKAARPHKSWSTHHTHTPSQWALQCLSHNVSFTVAKPPCQCNLQRLHCNIAQTSFRIKSFQHLPAAAHPAGSYETPRSNIRSLQLHI